jgi:predicted TIM-barrel fold metal-dependent hydrolase
VDFPICDSHVHVFDPKRFAYVTPRRFTPSEATVKHLKSNLKAVGVTNVVLIQPSVYGDNHACLLDALNEMGTTARGVAVISHRTTIEEMAQLHAFGVRGARLNLVVDHNEDTGLGLQQLSKIEQHIPSSWHVQLHVSLGFLETIVSHIAHSNRTYVLDHMGLPNTASGAQNKLWSQLLELMKCGRLYVKLSAPYLYSQVQHSHNDVKPFVRSLLAAYPNRLIWGSNWPHTQGNHRNHHPAPEDEERFRDVDNLSLLNVCKQWLGKYESTVLSQNAHRLYGF